MTDMTVILNADDAATIRAALRIVRSSSPSPESIAKIDKALATLAGEGAKRAPRWVPIRHGWISDDGKIGVSGRVGVSGDLLTIDLQPGDKIDAAARLPDNVRLCRRVPANAALEQTEETQP